VDLPELYYFDNDAYQQSGELWSLYAARDFLKGQLLLSYGDIVFDDYILQNLMHHGGEIRVAVDIAWKQRKRKDSKPDLVQTCGVDNPLNGKTCTLVAIGSNLPPETVTGDWIGLLYLSEKKTAELARLLDALAQEKPELLRQGSLPDLLNHLVQQGEQITVVHSYGHWHDLDDQQDLLAASSQG
jgi:phosphoenolpyruvate phosphomutase